MKPDACLLEGEDGQDWDEIGLIRTGWMISTRRQIEDESTKMRWGQQIRWESGVTDGIHGMEGSGSPQGCQCSGP